MKNVPIVCLLLVALVGLYAGCYLAALERFGTNSGYDPSSACSIVHGEVQHQFPGGGWQRLIGQLASPLSGVAGQQLLQELCSTDHHSAHSGSAAAALPMPISNSSGRFNGIRVAALTRFHFDASPTAAVPSASGADCLAQAAHVRGEPFFQRQG